MGRNSAHAPCQLGKGLIRESRQDSISAGTRARRSKRLLQQLVQGVFLAFDPVGGNALPGLVDDLFGEVHHLVEPRLKIVQRAHGVVDQLARVEALHGGFRKVPIGTVEGVPVVDHAGHEAGAAAGRTRRRRTMAR